MRDKRSVDDLSIEELERILAIKKRAARQEQLHRMRATGRVVEAPSTTTPATKASTGRSDLQGLPAATVQATDVRPGAPRFEDAPTAERERNPGHKNKREHPRGHRQAVNRVLLLVEVLAVVGLVMLGGVMLSNIGLLQRTTAETQAMAEATRRAEMPTIAPTPTLKLANVVLPGGHTPPTEAGGSQFNFDEIPAHMRPLFRDQIFLPPEIERPPQTPETALEIIIPKINVQHTIVQGAYDWDALTMGVGQYLNGVNPGDPQGNVVLAAHNDIYGEIFRHLDQLEAGDQFQIRTQTQIHTYTITGWEVVEPNAVHVLDNRSGPTATLISCYPYQVNTQRIVVFAERSDA